LKISHNKRKIQRTKRFARDIKKIQKSVQKEAFQISQKLADNIFSADLNVHCMIGLKGVYRVVVKRDYRMIFSFDADNLYLLRIGHRKEIYRKMEL
jgi:addiction module RelE/StbE family toxin